MKEIVGHFRSPFKKSGKKQKDIILLSLQKEKQTSYSIFYHFVHHTNTMITHEA